MKPTAFIKRVIIPAFTKGILGAGIFVLLDLIIYLGQTHANQTGYNEQVVGYQNFAILVGGAVGFVTWFLVSGLSLFIKLGLLPRRQFNWRSSITLAGFVAGFLSNFLIASSNKTYGLEQRSLAVNLIDGCIFGLAGLGFSYLAALVIKEMGIIDR